jgi:hypothetical protein
VGVGFETTMRLERHGPMVRALARRALLALALGCAGGTAVAQVNAPSTPVPLPRERPFAAHTEDMKCRRHEGACINRLRGLAWRDGDHLHLRLANGKTATFTTTSAACAARSPEKCLRFGLVGYYARHRSYLVDANYRGHGGVKLLVSTRTGEHVKLDAYPDFSPSGRRFAAVNSAESGDNSIEVWTASDPPKLEWRYVVPENEYSVYEFAGWDGDDRLKMRVTTRIGEEMHEAVPVEAVRTAAGWRLMPPMLDEA